MAKTFEEPLADAAEVETPKQTSNGTSYTQAELADRLKVSVTTVKKYLKRVRQIFEWLEDREFTDAKGKYSQWILEQLLAYQNACGASCLDAEGNAIENPDPISFEQYRDFVWNKEGYCPTVVQPAVSVSAIQPVTPSAMQRLGFENVMAFRETANDSLVDLREAGTEKAQILALIGTALGVQEGETINAYRMKSMVETVKKGDRDALAVLKGFLEETSP